MAKKDAAASRAQPMPIWTLRRGRPATTPAPSQAPRTEAPIMPRSVGISTFTIAIMKIRRIAAYRAELPLHEGRYNWSGGKSVTVFDSTIVRVETDAGLIGHGEVCPLGPFYLPAYAEGVRAGHRRAGAAPARRGPAAARQAQPPDGRGAQGPPLREVRHRHRVLGHPRPGDRAARVRRCSAGATARTSSSTARSRRSRPTRWRARSRAIAPKATAGFQLKVGGDPDVDIERIRAVRGARAGRRPRGRRQHRLAPSTRRPASCAPCATSTSTSSSPA